MSLSDLGLEVPPYIHWVLPELDSKYLRACGTLCYMNSFKAADPLWIAKIAERPDSEKKMNKKPKNTLTKTVSTH